jgi:hypothetical protein
MNRRSRQVHLFFHAGARFCGTFHAPAPVWRLGKESPMRAVTLILCGGLCAVPAAAQTFISVSPNSRALTEGNAQAGRPFADPTVTRYQQIYGAGSLSLMTNRRITHIAFRLDSSQTADYPGGFVYPNLTITLSTTGIAVAALSTNMQSNVGANAVTVYNGAFTLPTLHAGPAPRAFDLVIPLQTPFQYAGGNLLMDVQGPIGPATNPFVLDAESTAGDAVARAFSMQGQPTVVDSAGLVTRFTGESTGSCYANCDGSTVPPVLNVYDFGCFQWQYFAGTEYANCDGSTTPPVLNVADFTCFLMRFAAGCT